MSAHARTHTHRHLSLPEISVNVYAGYLRLPWVVPGDLAQKRRGYGWLYVGPSELQDTKELPLEPWSLSQAGVCKRGVVWSDLGTRCQWE